MPRRTLLAVAATVAAAAAPQALAQDPLPAAAAPLPPDAAALAAGILEQAGVPDPLPTLPVEQPLAQPLELPAVTAQPTAAEPATTGAAAAPPPEPVADPAPQPASPAPTPAPDPPPAVAVQEAPANVNVSVRIDSPGDDGAVTQANVAADAPVAQSPPDEAQYRPVVPPATAPPATTEAVADAPEPVWEWSWAWDCTSAAPPDVVLPAGLSTRSWIWNWNWNCGSRDAVEEDIHEEPTRGYQPISVQYRPTNINVSIRVASPGNNGPVVQANVAVALPAAAIPAAVAVPPPQLPAAPAPVALPVFPVEVATAAALATDVDPGLGLGLVVGSEQPVPGDGALDDCCLLPEPRGVAFATERPAGSPAGGGAVTADGHASVPGDTVAVAARLELRVRRAARAAAAPDRPQARPGRPTRHERRAPHEGPTAATQGSIALAPVGGPERSFPFAALVLLAFGFASTHSTLAAVRSRPTRGTDADEPPDPPG